MHILNFIIVLAVAISSLSFGVVIFAHNKRRVANRVYLLLTIFITLWTICNYVLQRLHSSLDVAIALNGVTYFLGFLSIYWMFLFSHSYPVESQFIKNKRLLWLTSSMAVAFAMLCTIEPIAGTVYISPDGSFAYTEPPLEFVFTAVAFLLAILIVVRYISVINSTKGPARAQAITMMVVQVATILIGVSVNLVVSLIENQVSGVYFSPLVSLAAVGFMGYAMSRHGLFDIRPYFARISIYILSVTLIFFTLIGLLVVGYGLVTGKRIDPNEALLIGALSIIAAILIVPIIRFFNETSNRYFYHKVYDPQEVLNTISSSLVGSLDIETLLITTTGVIKDELNVSFCDIYISPDVPLKLLFSGTNKSLFSRKPWRDFVGIFASNSAEVFTVTDYDLPSGVKGLMRAMGVGSVVKMHSKDQNIGYLVVGELKDGTNLTTQDIRLFEIIADEAAIAVQNAFQYEEIAQFNQTLKRKINEATRELQQSNDRLKALDKAKDEFISLASHQLRTPLTSVKGYISMVLDGDAGPLSEPQKSLLSQAFVSSQRMVYTISDLLNVSRVKTGSFVIEPKSTYLPDVVEGEVKQLIETAKAREQKLLFVKPQTFPHLNLDESKTRQVVMNLIDNAIYYTPKNGTINVELKLTKTNAEFTVKDTGIGVSKKDQKNLFVLFFRASNAQKMRPDGTGLGLFMVKKVVVSQGGHMIVKTAEGKGSTFGFSFPIAKLQTTE